MAAQLGREPRTFRRVAVRCPWGFPAVTEQEPYGADGEPFPTTYYLTCRPSSLPCRASRRRAGSSAGAPRCRRTRACGEALERATEEQVRVRRALAAGETGTDDGASLTLGIGGSRNPTALKCLHAHVAFALARPGYALGERVLAELPERWPSTTCCSASLS